MSIQLQNSSIEQPPNHASAVEALLYINKKLSGKPRTDLNIYAFRKL